MAIKIEGGVTAPKGFTAAGVHCGIRRNRTKRDLALIVSDRDANAAAVYTKNLVKGAPLTVTKAHLENGMARAIIVNSGIANTCAADGIEKAEAMCRLAADALSLDVNNVLVASTGVIGPSIVLDPIEAAMPTLASLLSKEGGSDAAEAIMTTDTVKKEFAYTVRLGGVDCTLGGIAKGSGMIAPNMATMLCFLTTDAAIDSDLLDAALHEVVGDTFNMLSVDGDTSTNDNVILLANGAAGNARITEKNADYATFVEALHTLCADLCRRLAKDGEGATKLIETKISGAKTVEDARTIAASVNRSSLLKAAMFGADANWGRVLCAIGYAGADVDIHGVEVTFRSKAGAVCVCKQGAGIAFDEDIAKTVLTEDEIVIDIALSDGDAAATAYGCDLTYDYVKINGDYRT